MNPELARTILLDHAMNPRNRVTESRPLKQSPPPCVGESRNPSCGDHVRVYLTMEGPRIKSCSLQVLGCAICTASASMMSEQLTSLACSEALEMRTAFEDALMGPEDAPWPAALTPFEAFSNLRFSRARIPCALIPWLALKEAIRKG